MAEQEYSKKESSNPIRPNNKIAAVIGLLFVGLIGFVTFRNFSDAIPTIGELVSSITKSEDAEGEITSGESTSREQNIQNTEECTKLEELWEAFDYKPGDITGNSHTVKCGDTLWELAEAKYGEGFQWTKILEANSSDIGYLPNGEQALIMPGQVLTIP